MQIKLRNKTFKATSFSGFQAGRKESPLCFAVINDHCSDLTPAN